MECSVAEEDEDIRSELKQVELKLNQSLLDFASVPVKPANVIPGRSILTYVSNKAFTPFDSRIPEQALQKLSACSDERNAMILFLFTWRFTTYCDTLLVWFEKRELVWDGSSSGMGYDGGAGDGEEGGHVTTIV